MQSEYPYWSKGVRTMKNELPNSKQKSKKLETSKVILITLASSLGILIPVVVILAFNGVSSPLDITMTGMFTLTTTAVGFYYWKAKCENMHKYHRNDGITMNGEEDEG